MASTSSPYGVQVVSDLSGTPRTARLPFGIASGYASNIFKYQPVKLVAATGTLQAITNPGGVPDKLFGIFAGIEYTPVGGRPVVSPFWAAGTVFDPGYEMLVYYWPCWMPGTRLRVQADGAVAQALMGSQFNFTNLAAGSTSTGLSTCTVGAAGVVAGSQGQLALTEFDTGVFDAGQPQGAPGGDAFTDLICTVAYPQIGFGPQTSIG